MFTEEQLENFKQQLLLRKEELLGLTQTNEEAGQIVELDQTRVGRLSRMDALQGQAMSQERKRRRDIELKNIDAALRRIERDEFGYCVACDEEIAMARLEFNPAVTHCISCASAAEEN